jgi:hypothetical protein
MIGDNVNFDHLSGANSSAVETAKGELLSNRLSVAIVKPLMNLAEGDRVDIWKVVTRQVWSSDKEVTEVDGLVIQQLFVDLEVLLSCSNDKVKYF